MKENAVNKTKVYLAGPVVASKDCKNLVDEVCRRLRGWDALQVYRPGEHKVPNEWGISQHVWGQCVFTMDVNAINESDWVVVCDFGYNCTSIGTAWECGYAFAKGKKILVITMPGVERTSLMIDGCASNIISFDALKRPYWTVDDFLYERGKKPEKKALT